MDIEMFWWDDEDYFVAYVKAYNERIREQSWFTGLYTLKAVEHAIVEVLPSAVGTLFSKNSNYKPEKFLYPQSPLGAEKEECFIPKEIEIKSEKELTDDELVEKKWREQLLAMDSLI